MNEAHFITEQAIRLREVLGDYGVAVAELDPNKAQLGPSVIRYRVRLSPGARIAKVRSSAEDIGRELAVGTTPLIETIPGEPYVGIDLARPHRATVFLNKALEALPTDPSKLLALNITAGVTPGGENVVIALSKLPHMLVAGSTASGKTVFLHSLLMSLITRLSKDQVEILLVDPKATDFPCYKNVPHLRGGRVFTDSEGAIEQIRKLTAIELDRRTEILQKAQAPNITEYNQKSSVILKPIVVIIDEYADLMSVLDKKERDAFEKALTRLAQRARSVGIHLVIATQRPSAEVISGLLKANIPARVAFRLPQRVDSQTALDQSGAENLLGMGDMLLKREDTMRLQGYFMPTEEIIDRLDTMFPPPQPQKSIVRKERVKAPIKVKRPSGFVLGARKAMHWAKVAMLVTLGTSLFCVGAAGAWVWYTG